MRRSRSPDELNKQQRQESSSSSSSSVLIPRFGLGTFRMKGTKCSDAVKHALNLGVRLIDSAESYKNAADIARGIAEFRKEQQQKQKEDDKNQNEKITIITKVSKESIGHKQGAEVGVAQTITQQIKLLYGNNNNTNDDNQEQQQLDVVLLHWPGTATSNPSSVKHREGRIAAWKALVNEKYVKKRVKIIGVSNFSVKHLRELAQHDQLPLPEINQVECHPYHQQKELREFCKVNQILVQAYTSLGRSTEPPRCLYGNYEPDHPRLVKDPLVLQVVKDLNDKLKNNNQNNNNNNNNNNNSTSSSSSFLSPITPEVVLLRWAIENDLYIIPKASSEEHIRDNLKAVQNEEFWKSIRRELIGGGSTTSTCYHYDWVKLLNDEIVVPCGGDGKQRDYIAYAYVPEKMPV